MYVALDPSFVPSNLANHQLWTRWIGESWVAGYMTNYVFVEWWKPVPITIKKVPITPLRASKQASKCYVALNIMGKDDAIFYIVGRLCLVECDQENERHNLPPKSLMNNVIDGSWQITGHNLCI